MVSLIPFFLKRTKEATDTEIKTSNVAPIIFVANQKTSSKSIFKKGPSFEVLTREGYQYNVISAAATNMRANAVASVEWEVLDKNGAVLDSHPMLDLLARPNVDQGQTEFFRELIILQIIGGEVFIESVKTNRPTKREKIPAVLTGPPKEIYAHRSDRFTIKQNKDFSISYIFQIGNTGPKKIFEVDTNTRQSEILHMKKCNPLDDFRGLSEYISIGASLDTANAISIWNKTLIDNEARPSGVLEQTDTSVTVTEADIEELKQKISARFSGPNRTGEPFVVGGGWTWKPLGMSVKDMDFLNMKHSVSRDISLGLGVPPLMLDIPGDSTFNNKAEARQWFFEGPVLQDLKNIQSEFNRWLAPMYGDGSTIRFNLDSHPAFADKRAKQFEMVRAWEVLTINERRQIVGKPLLEEGGDVLLVDVQADDEEKNQEFDSKKRHPKKKPKKKATSGPGIDGHVHTYENGDTETSTDGGDEQEPHNHPIEYDDDEIVGIGNGGDPVHDHDL